MPRSSRRQRDKQWVELIQAGDHSAFKRLFRAYADELCTFAATYVGDGKAEDIVQTVFCDVWSRRDQWCPKGSAKSYLFRAVRNTSLDHLKHRRVVQAWENEEKERGRTDRRFGPLDTLQQQELEQAMQQAVEKLPERRRLIYRLARDHDMSYAEIASALGIAQKTVENQIGRALKALRRELARFVPSRR